MKKSDNINETIARYRTLAGYTQESAATALGINKNSYARMERNGTPKPEMLKKLSELYNVPVQVLLYGENDIPAASDNGSPLKDANSPIKSEDPLLLTTNEKTIIKLCRSLTAKQRNEIIKYISDYTKKDKK